MTSNLDALLDRARTPHTDDVLAAVADQIDLAPARRVLLAAKKHKSARAGRLSAEAMCRAYIGGDDSVVAVIDSALVRIGISAGLKAGLADADAEQVAMEAAGKFLIRPGAIIDSWRADRGDVVALFRGVLALRITRWKSDHVVEIGSANATPPSGEGEFLDLAEAPGGDPVDILSAAEELTALSPDVIEGLDAVAAGDVPRRDAGPILSKAAAALRLNGHTRATIDAALADDTARGILIGDLYVACGGGTDAERDVALQVAEQIVDGLHAKWDGRSAFGAFVASVVANARREARRTAAKRSLDAVALDEVVGTRREPATGASDDPMVRVARRKQLAAIADALTPRQQQLLQMSVEGYTYSEIASRLNIAEESVGVMLSRIRKVLDAARIEHDDPLLVKKS